MTVDLPPEVSAAPPSRPSTHTVLYDPDGLLEAGLPLDREPCESLITAVLAWACPDTLAIRVYHQIALQLTGHARAVAAELRTRADRLPKSSGPKALADLVLREAEEQLSPLPGGTMSCVQARELSILLRGRPPSKYFIEALIKNVAPAELTQWRELWTATNRTPKAPRPPDAEGPRPPAAPSNGTDSRAALLTGRAWAVLGVVFAYTVTATFTAGLQADAGAGILNLIGYAVAALLSLCAAAVVLVGAILARLKSDAPFGFFLIASLLALPAGLIVPWYAAVSQPWYWIADHLGVI
ncbi:hypothetical protein [Streptomyces sp. NBC_01335]|uniref:hypothetical protein n=1 Tax=Streptomyces sp. NBC_01335 TaxID=2903828 RepID=UPI002E0E0DB5